MSSSGPRMPTIFLIEEDDETRLLLVKNLRADGYHVVVALDEEDALGRVEGGRLRADLVLVNLVDKSLEEILAVGRRVREHAEYDSHTPVVVMPEKYGEELEGQDVRVGDNDWITYPEDHHQLRDLLARLLPRDLT